MNTHFRINQSERGVILLIVLIITAILSILVVDLIYFTQIDAEISVNTRDDIKARYIAKSGVNIVSGTLKVKPLEDLKEVTKLLIGQTGEAAGNSVINVPYLPVGDGNVSLSIDDERAKINLNALVNQSTNAVDKQVETELRELFRFVGINSNQSDLFMASLINWLDHPIEGKQNDQHSSGASTGHYSSLENPYDIKDGPLDSLDEIRLIHGMDNEFFEKINDYVTVYPSDKKVNFSTASKYVMMAALKGAAVSAIERQESATAEDLKDDIAERIAEEVIEARQKDYKIDRKRVSKIIKDIDPTLGINAGINGVVLNSGESDVFSVRSTGSFGDENPTLSTVEAVIRKSSPGESSSVDIISWKEI